MRIDRKFVDSVLKETPHLQHALGEIMDRTHLFDDVDAGYDDDGEACLGIECSLSYPGPFPPGTNPEDGWRAAVYADQAELGHLWRTPTGAVAIVPRRRMPLGDFLNLLGQADWELGCRAGIFNTGRKVSR